MSRHGNIGEDLCNYLSRFYDAKHVFLFRRARVALYTLLKAYNRPGGVLVPSYTCLNVPEAVLYAGYRPVFTDIEYESLNMTAGNVKESISSDISAVIITHQYGIPCDVEEIVHICRKYGVLAVEDVAAAMGAEIRGRQVGTFGDAAIISFGMTKVVSAVAGGALLTNDNELAEKVSSIVETVGAPEGNGREVALAAAWKAAMSPWIYPVMQFGYKSMYGDIDDRNVNPIMKIPENYLSKCSRFSASLVFVQLDRLNWNLDRRREIAEIYYERLSGCSNIRTVAVPAHFSPSWIYFPLFVENKMHFYKYMQKKRINLAWTFQYSCAEKFYVDGFPNSQKAAQMVIGLPTYPSLSISDAMYICQEIHSYVSH